MLTKVVGYSLFFFFKQKTAYEMRISDWSSDVCSSDLPRLPTARWPRHRRPAHRQSRCQPDSQSPPTRRPEHHAAFEPGAHFVDKIGRASCRERVCQYV